MNSRIEQFVRDHREDFDSEEPDRKIWDKIAADLEPRKKKQGMLVRLGRAGWMAAAAVVLLAVGMIWLFSTRTSHNAPAVAAQATNHLPKPGETTTPGETVTPAGAESAVPITVYVHVCPLLASPLRRVRECQPEKYGKQTEDDERRADVEPLERVKSAVDRKHEGRLDQAKDEEEHPDTCGGQSAMSLGPP